MGAELVFLDDLAAFVHDECPELIVKIGSQQIDYTWFNVFAAGDYIGAFDLATTPTIFLDYIVSGNLFIYREGRGYAQAIMRAKIKWLWKHNEEINARGFLAHVNEDNVVQHHILTKYGWRRYAPGLWGYHMGDSAR